MLKDRIVEIGTKRVLLPERCSGPSESYTVKALCAILASDRHSVLVTGETGTGKEMLADCVMHMTKRPKGKCQRLNCAGLDSNLVGSELFGHKKGAFTGAESNREGLLKSCDGGVLFLDEIGWLLPDLQARLLRFMETGEIRPIGADRIEHHTDVRIVAATNKDVEKVMIHDLRARFDFEVRLPPLRERTGDILWFLCEPGFLGSGEVFTGITLRTLLGLLNHEWPGNIRELKKYCQRKVILDTIEPNCVELRPILEDLEIAKGDDIDNMDGFVRLPILDDGDIGKRADIDNICGFAGLALAAFEDFSKRNEAARTDPNALNVAALLAGLFECSYFIEHAYPERKRSVIVVSLAVLRDAINGTRSEFNELNLDTTIFQALEFCEPSVFPAVNPAIRDNNISISIDNMGLSDAIIEILNASENVARKMPDAFTRIRAVDGKSTRVPVGPSEAFFARVGFLGPFGELFTEPPPPPARTENGIESVLNELGTTEPNRSIALLCNRGLSNKEISKKVGLKPTTVGERLVKLRGQEKLKALLPKQRAGRKARKQPD